MEEVFLDIIHDKTTSVIHFRKLFLYLKDAHIHLYEPDSQLFDIDEMYKNARLSAFGSGYNVGSNVIEDERFLEFCIMNLINPSDEISRGIKLENNTIGDVVDICPGNEILFIFNVYAPFICKLGERVRYRMKLACTIGMLGSQTLNRLCDMILCNEVHQEVFHEHSDNPNAPPGVLMGEAFKSRMLYIGNDFYIDKSFEGYKDYSKPVKSWGKSNSDIGKFGETYSMHEKTCLDLVARVNYPYLFQHIGSCEHLVIIKEIRLLSSEDILNKAAYPFYTYKSRVNNGKYCMACHNDNATWLVCDEKRLPVNPSYLCYNCFISFQYVDGKKVSDFKAIRLFSVQEKCDMKVESVS